MKNFGWELILDLYGCDYKRISQSKFLKQFIKELCDKNLKVRREGDLIMKHYGQAHLEGYSIVQLIESSSVVGHFSEQRLSAHIDMFSCAPFDKNLVKSFTKKFFKAKKCVNRYLIRH